MIAKTPSTPYYAVIFSSVRTKGNNGYYEMSEQMVGLAAEQDGFLGMETARNDLGITVSYWRDLESVKKWRNNSEHSIARSKGRSDWYQSFKTRIAKVERDYEFEKVTEIVLRELKPKLNDGNFVFCTVRDLSGINISDILFLFQEEEDTTVVIKRELADCLNLSYSYIASWITLTIHSSLEEVGLTALFSKALSDRGISCNVVAAYNHDHIFVDKKDTGKAMDILDELSV